MLSCFAFERCAAYLAIMKGNTGKTAVVHANMYFHKNICHFAVVYLFP